MPTPCVPLALLAGVPAAVGRDGDPPAAMSPALAAFAADHAAEFDRIPADRRAALDRLAAHVKAKRDAGEPARLTFICTHNSRRSHLAQLWAAVAAERYGVAGVETFSGGTEATAFNPRAVAALRRAGFEVTAVDDGADAVNPRYRVSWGTGEPSIAFSKRYDAAPNPTAGFAAVPVCSEADEACPVVTGADARFALPYEDPKAADGTPFEAARYDERTAQIARELLYAFSRVP